MATLHRVTVNVSAFPGAPGVMTFHCLDAVALLPKLRIWLVAVAPLQPQTLQYDIQNSGDIFESTTGEVSGVWTATQPAVVASAAADTYSAGVGCIVHWKSDTYLSGRLLRGRSFIVPLNRSHYDTDGSLLTGSRSTLQTASNTFVTNAVGNLAVWQRPRAAKAADGSRPAVTARGGGHATVVSALVPDRGAWLSSRRP